MSRESCVLLPSAPLPTRSVRPVTGKSVTATYSQAMRHPAISGSVFLALLLTGITHTHADDRSVYVAPGPKTILAPNIANANQAEVSGSTRKLGDLIGGSLKMGTTHATDLLVTTSCGHYQTATITYADGTVKSLNLSNAPATKTDLEKAKAAIPILRLVDIPDCNS
jgi:hypothetical protein